MSERTRTWHPPAAPAVQVQDPAMRAILHALRRALAMGLDTDRSRQLLIAAIDQCCGKEQDEPP
jgi:hypothetical protein